MAGFKPVKACKVCQRVKVDKKLFRRLYASKHYMKGGESLMLIANEEGLQYPALLRHCKAHQHLTDEKLAEAQLNEIAKVESKKALDRVVRTSTARQNVVDKLAGQLENMDLDELSGRDVIALLLKATKDTDDVSAKQKDQNIDIFRLMGGVRSGEVAQTTQYEDFDPWASTEGAQSDIDEGIVVESE